MFRYFKLSSDSSLENSFTSNEEEKQDYQEELLLDFPDEERSSIFKVTYSIQMISYSEDH